MCESFKVNFSQIEEKRLGMLCVWGKKKLELEQRQQLGGGGAQSIKVGRTIAIVYWWYYWGYYFLKAEHQGAT